ncbi:MAG: hypothetical protein ACR2MS_07175 [Weeksellaceae bacterium]
MHLKATFLLFLFIFTLIAQAFYPAQNSSTTIIELVESNEEVKKTPLIRDYNSDTLIANLWQSTNDKKFTFSNDDIQHHYVVEVVVPPPKA